MNDDVVHVAGKVDPAEYKPNKTPGRRGLSGRRADPPSRREPAPRSAAGRAWKGLEGPGKGHATVQFLAARPA